MLNELSRLVAVNDYIPHGYCISWSPPLVWTFVISDVVIFLSYASMPVVLGYFAQRRRDFPYRWLLWLFAAFILACGSTHLMDAIVLWEPLYELDALLKGITALISLVTAVALWPLLPHALRLPSPDQLRQKNAELQREISERKRVEDELRVAKESAEAGLQKERALMAAIVESSDDAIVAKSLDGIINSWNQGAQRIFGYTAEEIVGQHIQRLIPPDRHGEEEKELDAIERGASMQHFETERICKDGSRIDVSVTVSPIRDQQGRIIGASKIARDITERKRAENEIRRLNKTLEARIVERTTQLQASNADLEQFAYVASHDLQEPLRMVVGYVQLLEESLADKLDAESREFMAFAVDGAKRMQSLIQDILAYSRVTTKGHPLAPTDSDAALKDALERLANRIAETGAKVEIQPRLPVVMADYPQLTQLFQNLIGNAVKFTKDRPPRVRVEAVHDLGRWRFSVTDNGIGIASEYRNRLFVIFKRLHTRSEFSGTGIGLAICKRIIERHGGEIGIDSASDGGSVFWFTLPGEKSA
jgi:PAS domain S-box-containing protein